LTGRGNAQGRNVGKGCKQVKSPKEAAEKANDYLAASKNKNGLRRETRNP